MPRPRPTTDQRQHIIRCDDKLWKKIATAATKAGVPINVYLNRVLNAAMAYPAKGAIDTVIDPPAEHKEVYLTPGQRAKVTSDLLARGTKAKAKEVYVSPGPRSKVPKRDANALNAAVKRGAAKAVETQVGDGLITEPRATKQAKAPERHCHAHTHEAHEAVPDTTAPDGSWWHTHVIAYGTAGHGGKVTTAPRVIPPTVTPAQLTSMLPATSPRPFTGPITKESQTRRAAPKVPSPKPVGKR